MARQSKISAISLKVDQFVDLMLIYYQKFSDRVAGTDFMVTERIDALGLEAELVHRPSPSGSRYVHRALRSLKITAHDRIIDIGSAKGSALRCMLTFPFGRICGIELSAKLAENARVNFHRIKVDRVEIFCGDALNFKSYHEFNMFYMYNPFPLSVAEQFFAYLKESKEKDHENILIYNNPVSSIAGDYDFKLMRSFPGRYGNPIEIYSDLPNRSRLLKP